LTNDAKNCGTCGHACTVANGTGTCAASTCAVLTCAAGFADCDGLYSNGCEASLNTTANCGMCGASCDLPNASSICKTGACAITSCTGTFADCDNDPKNGCETNLATSPTHCGACGTVCNATNGTPSCATGSCSITCNPGFGDCDGDPTNGCETNLQGD